MIRFNISQNVSTSLQIKFACKAHPGKETFAWTDDIEQRNVSKIQSGN